MGKIKHCNTAEVPPKRIRSLTCILHVSTLSEYGNFYHAQRMQGGAKREAIISTQYSRYETL